MRVFKIAAVSAAAVMVLAACGEAPPEEPSTTPSAPAAGGDDSESTSGDDAGNTAVAGDNTDFKACMVSDAGGFDDQSFNQGAQSGLMSAE